MPGLKMQQLTLVQEVQWLLFIKLMFWINCKYDEGVLLLSNFNQQHIAEYKFIELDAWKINLQKCTYCTQIFKSTNSTCFFWLCVPSKQCSLTLHNVQRGLKPTIFIVIPPFVSNHTFYKNKHKHVPTLLQIKFSKINMMQIYTIPLNTAIFLTSKPLNHIFKIK